MATLMQRIVTIKTIDNDKSPGTNAEISEDLKVTALIHPRLIITLKQDANHCNGTRRSENRDVSFTVVLLPKLPWVR